MIGIDGIAGADAPCHPMGEIGAVDDHENIRRDASATASAVCRISRRIFGSRFATAASPMIDSSSIGNSDDQPFARHRPAADALEPHGAAKALAQHLHQAGAEPVAGFLGRDQEDLSRDVGALPAPASRGKTGHEKAGGIGRLDHGLRIGDHGVAGDDRNPGKSGAARRPRRSAVRWSADRSADPARSWAPSPARRAPCAARMRPSRAQPRHPRQQAVGALDVLHPDHVAVDHDGGLTDVEGAERTQHVAPPARYRQRRPRPARPGSGSPRASAGPGATSLIPTIRKPSCSRMRPMPDSR